MDAPEEKPLNGKVANQEAKPKPKTFREKLRYVKENITVEPALICYVIPGALGRLATQNLNLDKACRVNLGYGDEVCDTLIAREGDAYKNEEIEVQKLIATMEMWKNVIHTAIPSLLILFLGAWSDRTGKRKACILMPIVGDLLMNISNILNAYFFYEIPVQVTMFLEAFLPAITGGWVSTYMGIFSYIGDVSSEESRTYRIGIVNLCMTSGSPIGAILSGILLKSIGYYGVFGICSVLYSFSIFYGYFYVKDPKKPPTLQNKGKEIQPGFRGFLKSFFDINHVKDTISVIFKKGPNKRRFKLILVFTAITFIYGPAYGEFSMRYMFTRYRFNWNALKYSIYNTYYICVHALGALISISLFSRRLKWHDSVLGMISISSKMLGSTCTGLAQYGYHMYIAVSVEIFNATSFTALRSISSKLVASNELGKMIAMFNLMEIVTSMVFGPIYSWIYMISLDIDAGLMFYISSVLTIPGLMVFSWFFYEHRKRLKDAANNETDCCKTEEAKEMKAVNRPEENETMLGSIQISDDNDITLHII